MVDPETTELKRALEGISKNIHKNPIKQANGAFLFLDRMYTTQTQIMDWIEQLEAKRATAKPNEWEGLCRRIKELILDDWRLG